MGSNSKSLGHECPMGTLVWKGAEILADKKEKDHWEGWCSTHEGVCVDKMGRGLHFPT